MSAVRSSMDSMSFVQRLEHSTRNGWYMLKIQQILYSSMNYQLVRCFPDFSKASYGERFSDRPGTDGFTILPSGVFWWLINIHPRYLVFHQQNVCTIEPNFPGQFIRQFRYDQLYVGNSNLGLRFSGNLYEGARAWYFSEAGGTEARFHLP